MENFIFLCSVSVFCACLLNLCKTCISPHIWKTLSNSGCSECWKMYFASQKLKGYNFTQPPRVNTFLKFLIIISIIIIIIIIQGYGSYSFPIPSAEMEKGRKLWCSSKLMIGSVIVCVNGSHRSKSQKLWNSFLSFYLRFWVYCETILRT